MFTLRTRWLRKFQGTTRSSFSPCWGGKIEVIVLAKNGISCNGFGYAGSLWCDFSLLFRVCLNFEHEFIFIIIFVVGDNMYFFLNKVLYLFSFLI